MEEAVTLKEALPDGRVTDEETPLEAGEEEAGLEEAADEDERMELEAEPITEDPL